MILFKVFAVGTWAHIIAVYPCPRHQLNQIFIAMIVFGQNNKVIAAHVAMFLHLIFFTVVCHIHLATKNGFERFFAFVFAFSVYLVTIVEQLFDAEHVTMVSNSHTAHTVGHGFVYEFLHARLPVEYRIVSVYV